MCRPVPQKTNMTLHVFYKNNSNFPQTAQRNLKTGWYDIWQPGDYSQSVIQYCVFTPKLLVLNGRLLYYPISKRILENDLRDKKKKNSWEKKQ